MWAHSFWLGAVKDWLVGITYRSIFCSWALSNFKSASWFFSTRRYKTKEKVSLECVLKSIWHEHRFLSVKRLLLKNSELKIWDNSDQSTRSYDLLNLPIFRSKFGPFCCSAKTWSRDQKRSSWRHLVGSSTASAREHNKYRYRVAGYTAYWLQIFLGCVIPRRQFCIHEWWLRIHFSL